MLEDTWEHGNQRPIFNQQKDEAYEVCGYHEGPPNLNLFNEHLCPHCFAISKPYYIYLYIHCFIAKP